MPDSAKDIAISNPKQTARIKHTDLLSQRLIIANRRIALIIDPVIELLHRLPF